MRPELPEDLRRLLRARSQTLVDRVERFLDDAPRRCTYVRTERVNYDHPAGFHWGTNWVYALIHPEDLAAGRLERAVVTTANA
ncbi:hypothetical protein OV207_11340 [Corallococcus sp. BB11-1]|uniref:hypothetical protein n=1 Tax=Corallococcus sp. BB11-1 TaxID=2996783 RepID=UPI002271CA2E|nr:hypothetical protein [Corallococcus sp. BB11-1]MCY1032053.1 hypothetical protein [Corallococcus sp. BB11-1]